MTFANAGTHEVENFFMIGTELGADLDVLCNAYSPLLEINNKGQLQPAVACTVRPLPSRPSQTPGQDPGKTDPGRGPFRILRELPSTGGAGAVLP